MRFVASAPGQSLTGVRLTIPVTRSEASWLQKTTGGGEGRLPQDVEDGSDGRYGSETVVPSPLLVMVNTPVAVSAAYVYAAQPDGGGGTEAINGPATWF